MNSTDIPLVAIEHQDKNDVLLKPAGTLTFPLGTETLSLIENMKKWVIELKGVGLAAPQVGAPYRLFVYVISEEARSYRQDASETIPLTTLINPWYKPIIEAGTSDDWERCFSVETKMGKIRRYKAIEYGGQDENGNEISSRAEGFTARVLQHEIDHLNGNLIVHLFRPDLPHGSMQEMTEIRTQELEERFL